MLAETGNKRYVKREQMTSPTPSAASSSSHKWLYKLPAKLVFLSISLLLCVIVIENMQYFFKNPDWAACVSKVMFIWALVFSGIINWLQYREALARYKGTQEQQKNILHTFDFTVFVSVIVIVAAVVSIFSDILFVPIQGWLFWVFPTGKNLLVVFLAGAYLACDHYLNPVLQHAKAAIKLDWVVLISLVIANCFVSQLARLSGMSNLHKEMILGYNTGMLVFHMTIATLLFEP